MFKTVYGNLWQWIESVKIQSFLKGRHRTKLWVGGGAELFSEIHHTMSCINGNQWLFLQLFRPLGRGAFFPKIFQFFSIFFPWPLIQDTLLTKQRDAMPKKIKKHLSLIKLVLLLVSISLFNGEPVNLWH